MTPAMWFLAGVIALGAVECIALALAIWIQDDRWQHQREA